MTDRATAPQTAQQAAQVGDELRREGRAIADHLAAVSVLLAKAERWLAEEEAIASEVEPFEARKTNADERNRAWGRHPFRARTSDVAWLVKAAGSAGLDGLDGERVETVADLRLVRDLLKAAVSTSEKRLRLHDSDSRHQMSVTSWAKAEYAGVMEDRTDDAPRPPRPSRPAGAGTS